MSTFERYMYIIFKVYALVILYVYSCTKGRKSRLYDSPGQESCYCAFTCTVGLNVSSSAQNCGCLADGSNSMASI